MNWLRALGCAINASLWLAIIWALAGNPRDWHTPAAVWLSIFVVSYVVVIFVRPSKKHWSHNYDDEDA